MYIDRLLGPEWIQDHVLPCFSGCLEHWWILQGNRHEPNVSGWFELWTSVH